MSINKGLVLSTRECQFYSMILANSISELLHLSCATPYGLLFIEMHPEYPKGGNDGNEKKYFGNL